MVHQNQSDYVWSIAIPTASVITMVARTSAGRLELEAIERNLCGT